MAIEEKEVSKDNKEQKEGFVTMEYTGSGGSAADIAAYRDSGDARVKPGDTVDVPEELAKRMVLSSYWQRADGTEKSELIELSEAQSAQEEASARRITQLTNRESHPKGLTGGEKVSKKPYHKIVAEKEAKGEVTGPENPDEETNVKKRLREIREAENADDADTGDEQENKGE